MLHYNLVSDNKTTEGIAKAINTSKNLLEIKKILRSNKINPKLLSKIISTFLLGEIPNSRAFQFMRDFKGKHSTFDLGRDPVTGQEKYIKINKLKKADITKQIIEVKKQIPSASECWVTFKFGCNPQFKNFDVIVGYAYKSNGNWLYSNLNQQETAQVNNYNSYNYSSTIPRGTVKSQGIAFKVFPLTRQEIIDSIETWLNGFPNANDTVYLYPGYSSYTTFVLSNDGDLDTKIGTTSSVILNALAFDLGSTCCPPQ